MMVMVVVVVSDCLTSSSFISASTVMLVEGEFAHFASKMQQALPREINCFG